MHFDLLCYTVLVAWIMAASLRSTDAPSQLCKIISWCLLCNAILLTGIFAYDINNLHYEEEVLPVQVLSGHAYAVTPKFDIINVDFLGQFDEQGNVCRYRKRGTILYTQWEYKRVQLDK